ncbi:hypothetical protein IGI57_000122 [Enterococcus sp. DIV0213j]
MNKHRNILLWSSVLISILQFSGVEASAERKNPIYDPTNPNQEVQPIDGDNYGDGGISTETEQSEEVENVEESTEESEVIENSKPKKIRKEKKKKKLKKRAQVILTDDLFDEEEENRVTDFPSIGSGGANEEESFYLRLISDLAGIAIYGEERIDDL